MHISLKKSLLACALVLPTLASAQNLVTNGSFASGLTGWVTTGGAATVINYGPGAAFGEAVPAASDTSLSPDTVGTTAVYFVEDFATQTLSQVFTVATAGSYNVGFDTYAPANGLANPINAAFSGTVDGTSVLTTNVSALPGTTWQAQTGLVNLTAGIHTVSFNFVTTGGGTAKDVVIDRVYVVATPVSAIPESTTAAMFAIGLLGLGAVARRRKS